jgi:eukaryotic-like serine/threonine-protein kinase
MSNEERCEQCGTELPEAGAACLRCMLAIGLEDADQEKHRVGDYELLEVIGRGGMGVVYKARQLSFGRIVALKMIWRSEFASAEYRKRFRYEAQLAAKLQHPNIVALFDWGEDQDQPFFSMEFVEGTNLAHRLGTRQLPPRDAAGYVQQVAKAVEYAHRQGVVHRDLKPENVMVDQCNQVKITDFGLAKELAGEASLTQTGVAMGSPPFMAPEQIDSASGTIGPWTDVYGVGALLYCLLSGRAPFMAPSNTLIFELVRNAEPASLRRQNPAIPADLETICLKCLSKEPRQRYPSAQAVADELGRWLSGMPIQARPVGWLEKSWRWARRKPVTACLCLALVMLMAVMVFWRVDTLHARRRDEHSQVIKAHASFAEGRSAEGFQMLSDALNRDAPANLASRRLMSALLYRKLATPKWGPKPVVTNLVSMAFSPSDDLLMATRADGRALLCDSTDGKPRRELKHGRGRLYGEFSRNGRYLATASFDAFSVRVWEVPHGNLIDEITYDGPCRKVTFDPSGTRILSLSRDGRAGYRDFLRKTNVFVWSHPDWVTDADFSPDGKYAATSCKAGFAEVWSTQTGKRVCRLTPEDHCWINLVRLTAKGQAVTASTNGLLRLWDLPGGHAVNAAVFGAVGSAVQQIEASPNGDLLISVATDGRSGLWSLTANGIERLKWLSENAQAGGMNHAFFANNGSWMVTASADGRLRILDTVSFRDILDPIGQGASVFLAAVTQNSSNQFLAVWDQDQMLTTWKFNPELSPKPSRWPKLPAYILMPSDRHNLPAAESADEVFMDQAGERLLTVREGNPKSATLWQRLYGRWFPVSEAISLPDARVVQCCLDQRDLWIQFQDGTVLNWAWIAPDLNSPVPTWLIILADSLAYQSGETATGNSLARQYESLLSQLRQKAFPTSIDRLGRWFFERDPIWLNE